MRTVYLGTSDFAATILRELASSEHRPALVVTRPARPKGRGKRLTDPPVADTARELAIELFQPESINDPAAVEQIASHSPEAICVCAFGAIVKQPLLSLVANFNVHPSLLPRWRGAAPIERAIEAGDVETGVSIMRLVEELDAGDVCAVVREPIREVDDYGSLAIRLAAAGGPLLVDALDRAGGGDLAWRAQQPPEAVTYAEKITRDGRVLDPASTAAVQLHRTVRALAPHIGAMLETTAGEPLRIDLAAVTGDAVPAGRAVAVGGRLLVGTPDGTLELLQLRPAGGKSMDAASYLRGNPAPELAP